MSLVRLVKHFQDSENGRKRGEREKKKMVWPKNPKEKKKKGKQKRKGRQRGGWEKKIKKTLKKYNLDLDFAWTTQIILLDEVWVFDTKVPWKQNIIKYSYSPK